MMVARSSVDVSTVDPNGTRLDVRLGYLQYRVGMLRRQPWLRNQYRLVSGRLHNDREYRRSSCDDMWLACTQSRVRTPGGAR